MLLQLMSEHTMEQNQKGKKGKEFLMRKSHSASTLQGAETRYSFSPILFLPRLGIHQVKPIS